jgi:hypothetical protein
LVTCVGVGVLGIEGVHLLPLQPVALAACRPTLSAAGEEVCGEPIIPPLGPCPPPPAGKALADADWILPAVIAARIRLAGELGATVTFGASTLATEFGLPTCGQP